MFLAFWMTIEYKTKRKSKLTHLPHLLLNFRAVRIQFNQTQILKHNFFLISLFLKFHGWLEWLIDRKVGLLPLGVVSLDVLFPGNTCVSLFTCALHGCFYFLSVSVSYTCPSLPSLVASVSYLLRVMCAFRLFSVCLFTYPIWSPAVSCLICSPLLLVLVHNTVVSS